MKKSNTRSLCLDKETETILATISHDLKNPIISITIAIQALNNPKISPLNSFQKDILENISMNLKYMKNLITNILDTYRIENQLLTINKTKVNFEEFINSILNETQYIFHNKNQTIFISSNLINKSIKIDALEMQRVVKNLLINASIYSPQNSEIKIKLFEKENLCYFSIENRGFGINNPEKIFDKFHKKNNCTKSISTGLGLYIVKEIIKKHAGKIFVESEKDNYIKITFALPIK